MLFCSVAPAQESPTAITAPSCPGTIGRKSPVSAAELAAISLQPSIAQGQQPSSDTPTFQATSNLVFLDVTVLDKKGRPVVKGLTKDDFTITEDRKPQQIFSFEPPETHSIPAHGRGENPEGKTPVTIFVLDRLNSSFEDFAFIRYSVRKYLTAQPSQLHAPTELMVIGNESLELLQGYTRSRDDLLYTLDHLRPVLPYKMMIPSFFAERFVQSIEALQQIALQNKGVPGRKNVVWLGVGGPGLSLRSLTGKSLDRLNQEVHGTTNMLVDARVSLYVIFPGLKFEDPTILPGGNVNDSVRKNDPFVGDVNFGVFVNETGGNLFYNNNDFDGEMKRSQELGSEYYTLTYQPHDVAPDGRFRRTRVTLRDPNLLAVTKVGYYAPDERSLVDPRRQLMINLAEAARSTVPFTALDMKVSNVVRHPDSRSVELTLELRGKNLGWLPTDDGKSTTRLIVGSTSMSRRRDILASKFESLTYVAVTQDPSRLAKNLTRVTVTLQLPRKTQSVRVVVQAEEGGQIGTVDVDRRRLDAAPAMPTPGPEPGLEKTSHESPAPAKH